MTAQKLIWGLGLSAYALFWLWYNGVSGALTDKEIANYSSIIHTHDEFQQQADAVIAFMQEDDGKQFVMQNLINFPEGLIEHPDTKLLVTGSELVNSYFEPFMVEVFKRAGHPAFVGRTQSPNIEQWGLDNAVQWQAVGLIRYRSRRDLMELVLDPQFAHLHIYKQLALSQTVAFPVQPMYGFYLSPNIWFAMLILIFCSSTNLILVRRRLARI